MILKNANFCSSNNTITDGFRVRISEVRFRTKVRVCQTVEFFFLDSLQRLTKIFVRDFWFIKDFKDFAKWF